MMEAARSGSDYSFFLVDLSMGKVRRRAKVRREGNEEKRGHFEENFEDFRFQS